MRGRPVKKIHCYIRTNRRNANYMRANVLFPLSHQFAYSEPHHNISRGEISSNNIKQFEFKMLIYLSSPTRNLIQLFICLERKKNRFSSSLLCCFLRVLFRSYRCVMNLFLEPDKHYITRYPLRIARWKRFLAFFRLRFLEYTSLSAMCPHLGLYSSRNMSKIAQAVGGITRCEFSGIK